MHIAIIPDGNRRWARERNLPGFMGHKTGADTMEKIIDAAFKEGVEHLTIWGASVLNITERTKEETGFLFSVFESSFNRLAGSERLKDARARVEIIGEWRNYFPESLIDACDNLIGATKNGDGPTLTFALAYSGTGEMIGAVKKIADKKSEDPGFEITKQSLKENLMTAKLPAVDLVIRTGGEPHWSDGFMMWDTANSQLYFTETLWPAFSEEEFRRAIGNFSATERRMGK